MSIDLDGDNNVDGESDSSSHISLRPLMSAESTDTRDEIEEALNSNMGGGVSSSLLGVHNIIGPTTEPGTEPPAIDPPAAEEAPSSFSPRQVTKLPLLFSPRDLLLE